MSVSDVVIARAMRAAVPLRFDPAQARDLRATFELRVRPLAGRPAVPLTLQIDGAECRVLRGAPRQAGAVVSVAVADLLRLAGRRVSWPTLLSSGRLQLTGDPFLALRFPMLFRLPASVTI